MMNHPTSPPSPKRRSLSYIFLSRKKNIPIIFIGLDYFGPAKPGKCITVNPVLIWWVTHVLHSSCVLLPPPSQKGSVLILHWAGSRSWTFEYLLQFGPFRTGYGTVCGHTKKALSWKIALNCSGHDFCCSYTFLVFGNFYHHPKQLNKFIPKQLREPSFWLKRIICLLW